MEPPIRLHHLRYDEDGRLRYPKDHACAPLTALARYLRDAEQIVATAPVATVPRARTPGTSDAFEDLRWFELPTPRAASPVPPELATSPVGGRG